MNVQHAFNSPSVRPDAITTINTRQASSLIGLGKFYSDSEQTKEVRAKLVNFAIGHDPSARGSFFFLYGMSGVGKTTVLQQALTQDIPEQDGWSIENILSVLVPRKCNTRTLTIAVLNAMGDPYAMKNTSEAKLTMRMHSALKRKAYRLVAFDNCHHLLDDKSMAITEGVADFFKEILDECNVSVVVVGTPQIRMLVSAKDEVKGRQVKDMHLTPFSFKARDERNDFRLFLKRLDAHIPGEEIGLSDILIAEKLHFLSGGRVGFLWRLIWNALERAYSRNDERMTTEDIGNAFEELRTKDEEGMDNVFL
jgi:hypothetical protein